MSVIVKKQENFFFSSSTNADAVNVSPDGARFSVNLNKQIAIPSGAVYCDLGVLQSNIWNTSPNISPDFKNNLFKFTTSNAASPGDHTITIPAGLYSLSSLNTFLGIQFVNLGLPDDLIVLSGDDSTQRTVLTFKEAGDQVDFTIADTVREVFGFNARLSPATPQIAGYSDFSDNVARFNRNNSYLIRSNLISTGIPINSLSANIIAQIPIDVSPGSQINYQPRNVLWSDASELIGNTRLNLNFELVNQDLQPTPTSGDTWSFVLTIRYGLLLTTETLPLNPSN